MIIKKQRKKSKYRKRVSIDRIIIFLGFNVQNKKITSTSLKGYKRFLKMR